MKQRTLQTLFTMVTAAIVLCFTLQTSYAQDPGFFLDDWMEKTAAIPDTLNAEKPAAAPTVTILVDAGEVVGKVPQYIYGNNAVTWDNGLRSNATAMTDLINLDPHVLRWPGGNLSNEYFWNLSSSQRPTDIPAEMSPWYGQNTADWQMSVDEYYDLLNKTNSTGIICVNYSYARYGTGPDPVAKAAHMAAEWVRYDHGRSKFWEIGNENFGNWQTGYQIDVSNNQDGQPEFISGQLYGQHCRVFIDSMRAAAAEIGVEIKIGVNAFDAETSWDPIQTVWNEQMMPLVGDLADFLVVHSYFTPYNQNSTVSTILNSYGVAEEVMSTMVSDMAEAGKPMIPVAFTEWNIFAVGSMQAVSYINGMHAALVLGESIASGYGQTSRWDLVNGWDNGNDHGMFSKGEPGVDPYNPRPAFFYMYYFQHYFGDRMVDNLVTGNSNIMAYSSTFSSGETGLVIINKGNSAEIAEVELENIKPGISYYHHTLTGGTDNGDFSRKVFVNGIGTDEEGGGPDEYESIKAYSSRVEGGIKVDLPPLSVVYLMVDQKPPPSYVSSKVQNNASLIQVEISEEVLLTDDPNGFEVMVNGTIPNAVTGSAVDPVNPTFINLTLEQELQNDDIITLSYTGTEVMSLDSVVLTPFSGLLVENLLPGAAPILNNASTSDDGGFIQLQFNKEMQVTSPSAGSFVLMVTGEGERTIDISDVSVDAEDSKSILLIPADSLYADDDLLLSYSGNGISSVDGGLVEPFDSLQLMNVAPGKAPSLSSAELVNYGFSVRVMFDKPMADLSTFDSLFTVRVNGAAIPIEEIYSDADSMIISLSENVRYEESVTLSYQGTSATSTKGGILPAVEDFPVVNGLPEPFVFQIPGTVDAELFTINMGMVLEPCSDEGGGYNLGYIDPGDWLEFEVEVQDPGYYTGELRVAAANATGLLVIQTPDGEILNQTVPTPVTGGWQVWASTPLDVGLVDGRQRLRLLALTGNYNLNWLSLEYDRPLQASFASAATNGSGDTVFIEFDKTMAPPPGRNPAGFTLMADGIEKQVASATLVEQSPNTLRLVLLSSLTPGQVITLSYEGGSVVDVDNQPVFPFSDKTVSNEVVTSVAQVETTAFTIFPNPVSDQMNIQATGALADRAVIQIMNVTGKTVYLNEFTNLRSEPLIHIDMGSLKEGLYLIRITSEDQLYHQAVIKK